MSHRANLIADVFDVIKRLPWWMGVIVAGCFWVVGATYVGKPSSDSLGDVFRPYLRLACNAFALVCLAAAVASAARSARRRRSWNRQCDLESLKELSWREFEQIVGEAYRRQGYIVNETGGGGADGGVDLILRRNRETVLVQCKRWTSKPVGVDKVRELFGVLSGSDADRAILVTCGKFTSDARNFAEGKPLTLVDGAGVVEAMEG